MHFICLCPTYGRPSLIDNTLFLFTGQSLRRPHTAHLVIYDDADQIVEQGGNYDGQLSWQVITEEQWIPLPAKYNRLLDRLGGIQDDPEVWYVVWDDDDVYLPWHLRSIVRESQREPNRRWYKPSTIWSTYSDDAQQPLIERLHLEDARGRFHGSIAIRGDLLAELDGWPETLLATYDQQMIGRLHQHGPPLDPWYTGSPSYVYRWGDTGKHHASGAIDQDGYYRRPALQEHVYDVHLSLHDPDRSTRQILAWMARREAERLRESSPQTSCPPAKSS